VLPVVPWSIATTNGMRAFYHAGTARYRAAMVRRSSASLVALLLLVLVSVACSSEESWDAAITAADPLFGGAASAMQRVQADPRLWGAGDASERRKLLEHHAAGCEQHARALVRELAHRRPADAVLAFWRSEPGNALARAELTCLTAFRHHGDDFPRAFLALARDPQRVGEAARADVRDTAAAMQSGASPSPNQLSMRVGVALLQPADATAIDMFFRSDTGRAWLEVRARAFPRAEARFKELLYMLAAAGAYRHDPDPDTVLPRAVFSDPPRSPR
jgi:hypothetical protein